MFNIMVSMKCCHICKFYTELLFLKVTCSICKFYVKSAIVKYEVDLENELK